MGMPFPPEYVRALREKTEDNCYDERSNLKNKLEYAFIVSPVVEAVAGSSLMVGSAINACFYGPSPTTALVGAGIGGGLLILAVVSGLVVLVNALDECEPLSRI